MLRPRKQASRLLLGLCLWLAVSVGLFLLLGPLYSKAVLSLSEFVLRPFLATAVTLNEVLGRGIMLSYPGIPQPLGFRFQLPSITLNLVFATALVMTTMRATSGWPQSLLHILYAVLVMLALHTYHVVVLIMHFLTQAPNPLVAPRLAGWLGDLFHINYGFADKMGYTLFPFLAWVGVCHRQILSLLGTFGKESGLKPDTGAERPEE
ncbi:MAG: hypothetical protein R3202_03390 [Candidatus Competibacterales bacterium]|nr:hypothetical protein [Candidatus Competibacterales bacterium]